jgi:tRNA (guanine37-N1)-methyltransferase
VTRQAGAGDDPGGGRAENEAWPRTSVGTQVRLQVLDPAGGPAGPVPHPERPRGRGETASQNPAHEDGYLRSSSNEFSRPTNAGRRPLDPPPGGPYSGRPFSRRNAVLFVILTLFPEALEPYLRTSILGQAQRKGKARILTVDFRDFTRDRHRTVDDRPFGGGPGMVLKPEPIFDCVEWLERRYGAFHKILMSPQGQPFHQRRAEDLVQEERVLLLCGRYEGFDERVRLELEWDEISIGDYVLAGGELPALSVTEAVCRLVPGVLGDERSAVAESFGEGGGLDHPQFTRPRVWRGRAVPDVLVRGDHAEIAAWRERAASERTQDRRPDLGAEHERPVTKERCQES